MLVSIITPAYNEAENLPLLYDRLQAQLSSFEWEWVIVDDHSHDETYATAESLRQDDQRISVYRLARNSGSHTAIICGLEQSAGDCAIVLAADLQDPPESIPELIAEWRSGGYVVWAVRGKREGHSRAALSFSRLYYFLMRKVFGMADIPAEGADFFLLDRRVIDGLSLYNERHVSILALISWLGFEQRQIQYTKQARQHGRSGWSLEKKLKLVADSVTSFSYLPIRLMSYAGFTTAVLGFIYAILVVINGLRGRTPEGWAALMVVVLVVGGMQMLMMGILGEYIWRAFEEAKRRPRYLIEKSASLRDTASN